MPDEIVNEIENAVNPELSAAEKAVKAYEDAKIGTAKEITAAKALKADAVKAVNNVKDATKKSAFEARIAAKDKAIAEAEAKSEIKVESVSAINNSMIQIKFNKAVDKSSATNINNYEIDGQKLTTAYKNAYVNLEDEDNDDETVVDIFLQDNVAQDKKIGIKVKDVLEKDTYKKMNEYTTELQFKDVVNPKIVSSEVKNGNKKLQIVFSEPVGMNDEKVALAINNYRIDGKELSAFGVDETSVNFKKLDDAKPEGSKKLDYRIVEIPFTTALPEGQHELTVKEFNGVAKITDTVGLPVINGKSTFTVSKDKDAMTVKQIKATAGDNGKVEVEFNKDIDEDSFKSLKSQIQLNGTNNTNCKIDDDNTIVIYGKVEVGENLVVIPRDLKDVYGNKISKDNDLRLTVKAEEDKTAPTIKSVYAINDETIRVVFSEDVDANFAKDKNNYEIKDNAGDVKYSTDKNEDDNFTVETGVNDDDAIVDIKLGEALDGSQYVLNVKGVRDLYGNSMENASIKFTVPDDTKPTLKVVTGTQSNAVLDKDNDCIEVFFSEAMDSDSLLNKSNYRYEDEKGEYKELPASATVEAGKGNKSVKITFPSTIQVESIGHIQVFDVKDVAGNILKNKSEITSKVSSKTGINVEIKNNSASIEKDVDNEDGVTVSFRTDEEVTNIKPEHFVGFLNVEKNAKGNDIKPTSVTSKNTKEGWEVTLKYANEDDVATLKAAGNDLKINKGEYDAATKNGDKIEAKYDIDIEDKVQPEIDEKNSNVDENGVINLSFNEKISSADTNAIKSAIKTITIGTTNKEIDKDGIKVDGNTVKITLKDSDEVAQAQLKLNYQGDNISIKDVNGNEAKLTKDQKDDGVKIGLSEQASVEAEAAKITALTVEGNKVKLPTVAGYDVAIKSSSDEAVIAKDGTVTPAADDKDVDLVLTLTKTGDNTVKADTKSITVKVAKN
nr:hypothetical protein [Clostridium botulinum]